MGPAAYTVSLIVYAICLTLWTTSLDAKAIRLDVQTFFRMSKLSILMSGRSVKFRRSGGGDKVTDFVN